MLLEALAACAGVTLKAVATALGVPLVTDRYRRRGISTSAGRSASPRMRRWDLRNPPVFELDSDAPEDQLAQLVQLTERYCVVYQTIRNGSPVDVRMQRG